MVTAIIRAAMVAAATARLDAPVTTPASSDDPLPRPVGDAVVVVIGKVVVVVVVVAAVGESGVSVVPGAVAVPWCRGRPQNQE